MLGTIGRMIMRLNAAVVVNRNALLLRCPGCVGPDDEVPVPNYRPTRLERLGVPLKETCTKCGRKLQTMRGCNGKIGF